MVTKTGNNLPAIYHMTQSITPQKPWIFLFFKHVV